MQNTLKRLHERREELGDEGGFTLIELLIVIVVLGILAAIVVFAVQNLTGNSAQAACASDLQTVDHAAEAFIAQVPTQGTWDMTTLTQTTSVDGQTVGALAAQHGQQQPLRHHRHPGSDQQHGHHPGRPYWGSPYDLEPVGNALRERHSGLQHGHRQLINHTPSVGPARFAGPAQPCSDHPVTRGEPSMIASKPQPPARESTAGERGFTLIELIIVIVILGILSGIAVIAVQGMTSNSVVAACQSDYKSVEVAVESFKAQLGNYPTSGYDGVTGANAVPYLRTADTLVTPSIGPWLRDNPTNGSHYQIQVSTDGSGTVQVWTADGSGTIPASGPTGTITDCNQAH